MKHLLVLSFLPILVVGTLAISTARRAQREPDAEYAAPLLRYLVYLNLLVVVYFAAKYAVTNLSTGDVAGIRRAAHVGVILGSFVAAAGSAYWLLRTAFAVWRRPCPRMLTRLYFSVISLFALSHITGLALLVSSGSERWLRTGNAITVFTAFLACIAVSARMTLSGRNERDPWRGRSIAWLGSAFLVGYCAAVASMFLAGAWRLVLTAASLLWLDYSSLHWLKSRADSSLPVSGTIDVSRALDDLSARFGITPREKEVVDLLFQGRSYKEIEDLLCISLGTVKNHAYNVYRKAGVSSRAQLIHLLINDSTVPHEESKRAGIVDRGESA